VLEIGSRTFYEIERFLRLTCGLKIIKRGWEINIVKMRKSIFVALACFFTLFLSATESYSHTIIADVDGTGGTISPFGAVSVPDGAEQTFTIMPELGYEILDVVTDAGSMGPVASFTFTNVTADDSITVSFSACVDPFPVMLESDGSYHDTIMEAYDLADPLGDTIMLRAGTFPEVNLFFDQDASVALRGGYDCSFVNDYMLTSIPGSLTISAGKVTPSNIVISSPPACAPGDPNNFPGNPEICDGADNNCNGLIDDGLTFDADHDGHTAIGSCEGTADDCNDNASWNYPGNTEICDNKDNNCDGQIDEGFVAPDNDGDGYAAIGSCGVGVKDDCDDSNSSINPGATEYYGDGIDQNCDGYDLYQTFDQNCFNCHWIGWVNDSFHHVSPPVDPNIAPCVDCHAAQVNNVMYGHYGRVVNTAGNNMDTGDVIYCTSCHDWHDPFEWNGFTNQARIVWPKVQAVGEGNETCDTCHENRPSAHATETAHNNRVIDPTCAYCHSSDTTNLGQPGNGTLVSSADVDALHRSDCTLCHNYTGTAPDAAIVAQAIQDGENGVEISCLDCHGVEFPTIHAFLDGHYNLIKVDGSICGDCHNSAPPLVDRTDPRVHQGCYNCHNPDFTRRSLAVGHTFSEGDTGGNCTTCHGDHFPEHTHHYGAYNDFNYDPNVDTSQYLRLGCAECHHDYDTANGTTVGLTTFDAILYEHDLDGTKNGSTNSCDTCHFYDGSGSPDLQTVRDAISSGNPATCATCHPDKVPDVNHASGGKHEVHLAMAGVNCDQCHDVTDFPYFKSGTDTDGDGKYTLAETDVCNICHQDGNGNPADQSYKDSWDVDGFVLACNSCHGAPPPNGAHLYHFGGPSDSIVYGDLRITKDYTGGQVSSVNMIGCGNCHPMDPSSHGNGVWGDVELTNVDAPAGSLKARSPDGSFDTTTKTCNNVYCHSANSWATDGAVPMPWPEATGWDKDVDGLPAPLPDNIATTRAYKQVNWNAGHTLGCTGCHDNPPESSYEDNDGGAGNSHYWVDSGGYENMHVWNMGYDAIGCRTCHYNTVQDASTVSINPSTNRRVYDDVALYDKSHHVNGSVDVDFDTVNNFTYDSSFGPLTADLSVASFDQATKTCSNVACHLQQTQVTWGLPYRWYDQVECNRCHGNIRTAP
jgi:predicted CxxxxCH...CXXCH cytochrome family protein